MHPEEKNRLFQQTMEEHKGILFKVARAYCVNETDRQDLVQEMMVQVWASLHRYNRNYKISTWLYRISLNVAISFYRKHSGKTGRYPVPAQELPEIAAEERTEGDPRVGLLRQFISELKEMDKAIMILYLEEKSHAEIAAILGMTVSTVGTRIARSKEKLKTRFAQQTS